jgi:hypothetical protein
MFPILLVVYRRLAIAEEREVRTAFGLAWDAYAFGTPRFIPRMRRLATSGVDATTIRTGDGDSARASTVNSRSSVAPVGASGPLDTLERRQ